MPRRTPADQLLIGAHTSAAGGAHNALIEGNSIGATTVQLFTANQRQWRGKPLTNQGIEQFRETMGATGLRAIMSHASYLINLGSPNEENRQKSIKAFYEEVERCRALGIAYMNFHPGAALDDSREACLDRIVEGMLEVEDICTSDGTRLLLETTAGQGSTVGATFEELAYILDKTKERLPVGVCIDTCHIFVAGYDIRTSDGWQKTLKSFDKIIGLEHLHAFHLNDSLKGFNSRRDRHAPLGEGEIGLESFKFLMRSELTREVPKYMETPGGPPLWEKEISMLREFARGK
ncbi:MAG: deoxyribonuclease IV [Chlamydiales bacterium]|nr:deoxyribonuclease IV [Chlamydiales bacterium]